MISWLLGKKRKLHVGQKRSDGMPFESQLQILEIRSGYVKYKFLKIDGEEKLSGSSYVIESYALIIKYPLVLEEPPK